MRKKIYLIIILFLLFLMLFILWKYNIESENVLLKYNDFILEENKIVKYNSTGNVVIPKEINGVLIEEIGDYAFFGKDIDNVVIPDTIVSIGDYAFANNNISSLTLSGNLTIGEAAFMNNKIVNLKIGKNVLIGNACFNNNLLEGEDSFFYSDSSKKELISYGGKIKGNVTLSDSVEIIGEKAFYNTKIVSITIPTSVYEIKKEAFRGNNLIDIYLSNNISLIASDAFVDNNYLVDVTINNKENSVLNYPWGLENFNINWLKK